MKAILMSIRPQHLVNILNGKKTIELRKKFPSDYRGWVYAYCTKTKPFLYEEWDGNEYKITYTKEWQERANEEDYTSYEKFAIGDPYELLNGKVVCRFWVDNVEEITVCPPLYEQHSLYKKYEYLGELETSKIDLLEKACVNADELTKYLYNEVSEELYEKFYAIHISKLEIFDEPKELSEFYYYKKRLIDCGRDCPPYVDEVKTQVRKAPQSWQYIYIEEII